MTNLIKFGPIGRNGGPSAPIDAIHDHFEPNWGQLGKFGIKISWSRPRSKFMKRIGSILNKVLDKMGKI